MSIIKSALLAFRSLYIVVCLHFFLSGSSGQGLPTYTPVKNYSKNELNIGQQTWQIDARDPDFVYFANNGGLVIHDGKNWEKLPTPKNTIVRSVKKAGDKIYVGSQGEFGYYELKNHQYVYTALSDQMNFQNFNDVWHIEVNEEGEAFFRSDESIFYYDGTSVNRIIVGSGKYNFLGLWERNIVVQDNDGFLFVFRDGTFHKPDKGIDKFTEGRIVSFLPYTKDTTLIATVYDGIFLVDKKGIKPWITSNDNLLKSGNIYCASSFPGLGLALGTSYNGIILVDRNRQVRQPINKTKGLQNNSVLSINFTTSGDIWAGLDNGISFVDLNPDFQFVYPDGDLEGTGYSAQFFKGQYFFGTNTGVYIQDKKNNSFHILPGTAGQVWSLQIWHNFLIINHHNGLFIYDGSSMQKISEKIGWWRIIPLSDSLALAGNYDGIFYLHFNQNKFTLDPTPSALKESSRILASDINTNVWIAHPYRGVFILPKSEWANLKTKTIRMADKSPDGSDFYFTVFQNGEKVLLQSKKYFYTSTDGKNFTREPELEKWLNPEIELRYFKKEEDGTRWFVTKKETGFLHSMEGDSVQKKSLNEIHGRLPEGFQAIIRGEKQHVIFPLDKGFSLFDKTKFLASTRSTEGFVSKINFTLGTQDSSLYFSHLDSTVELSLPHHFTNLFIFLSGSHHAPSDYSMYSYKIDNDPWSDWNRDHVIRLYSLSSGHHDIKINMMNEAGDIKSISTITVLVSYPWYRSPVAFILYLFIGIYLVFRYIRYIQENHRKELYMIAAEKEIQEQRHLAEKEHAQNEIVQLQNEKLTNELSYKNQELASYTYHLVSKNELIQGIDEEITKLEKKYPDHKNLLRDLRNIHRLAEQNMNADEDWEKFINNFDQVHAEFFKRLTDTFPDLSPSDYKLCTYLRMNLTSKEIASIMNISLRSVETNRYRLRKKMHLDTDVNLVQFLINF